MSDLAKCPFCRATPEITRVTAMRRCRTLTCPLRGRSFYAEEWDQLLPQPAPVAIAPAVNEDIARKLGMLRGILDAADNEQMSNERLGALCRIRAYELKN
jgi:hypothetical protein